MNFDNYTIKSQEALQQAQQIALGYRHSQIENEHLFKAIYEIDQNVLPFLLKKLDINLDLLLQLLNKALEHFPTVSNGDQKLSRETTKTLQKAALESKKSGGEFVAIEDLLIAIFSSKSSIAQMLKDQGVTEKDLKGAIESLRKGHSVTSQSQEDTYNALNKYATNLNQMAKDNRLDPVIGRNEEIRRILQILSRRTKNNPILGVNFKLNLVMKII